MLKLIYTHLFLNLYLLLLMQPALPFIEYFVNYDFIVQELCENKDKPILSCNGKCYLEDQVKEHNTSLEHHQQMPEMPSFDLSTLPVFLLVKNSLLKIESFVKMEDKLFLSPKETMQEIVYSIFHPPQ